MKKNTTSLSQGLSLVSLVIGLALLMLYITFQLTNATNNRSLAPYTSVYVDTAGELSIADIQQVQQKSWVNVEEDMNYGLSLQPHWFQTIIQPEANQQKRVIEFDYAMLDTIELWFFEQSSKQLVLLSEHRSGDATEFSNRSILHDKFLFTVPESQQAIVLFVRVNTSGPLKAKTNLWDKESYISYVSAHRLFMGLFFGYMIAMGLSNLFLFVTTRNPTFLVYSGYVLVFALLIATLHGISFRYLWPQNIWLQERAVAIFSYLMMGLIVLFAQLILKLKTESPLFSKILQVMQILYFVSASLCLLVPYSLMIKLLLVTLLITIPILLVISFWMAFKGSQIAKYFSAAWAVLLLSGLSASADNFRWVEFPIDSSYLLMVGATIETLLLALALAMSFDDQRKEARAAQLLILESEKAATNAKDELLKMQEEAQEQLEYRVDERTLELEIALRELSDVNNELERLSSIDALTGLVNRRTFDKRILAESRRSRRERTPLAIAMLDIDHFKKVNDTYGHQAGDECLKQVSTLMQNTIKRPSDILCRYGGEEFIAILPNTTLDGAKSVIEGLRLAIESHIVEFEGDKIRLTISAGVTSRVIGTDEEDQLMVSYADKQLYLAKESGRNRVCAGNF